MTVNIKLFLYSWCRTVTLFRRRFFATFFASIAVFFLLYWLLSYNSVYDETSFIEEPTFPFKWDNALSFKERRNNYTDAAQVEVDQDTSPNTIPSSQETTEVKVRPACKLPVLDPYHESVMAYIKELGQIECGEPYSRFENNTLTVEGENIVAVNYRIISRPEKSDFSVALSDPVDVANTAPASSEGAVNRSDSLTVLKAGESGCIVHTASKKCLHPHGGVTRPIPGTRIVFHEDCCQSRLLFTMRANGTIKHLPSGLCLHGDARRYGTAIVLHRRCSTVFRVFNGSLSIAGTDRCLQPASNVNQPDNDEMLISGSDCNARYSIQSFQGVAFKGSAHVNHDFILVKIIHGSTSGETAEVHMNTAPKPEVLNRRVEPAGIPVNVVLIMFDSTSAANFQRKMPKTNEYLKELPTVFLKGQTIVGDGTTAQLCAMLTGIDERYQPEARRRMPGAKHVDDWRWIFRDYARRGYVTMFSEDSPGLGTFNYRLKGFKNPPTDHYGRYFWLEAHKHQRETFCTGNLPTHLLTMKYLLSLFRTYSNHPKFAFLLFSDLVHNSVNTLEYGDEDLYFLLRKMEDDFFLEESVVIIFGDHGYRFGKLRKTLQGKLEERLPHMSITFPKWFPLKFPTLYETLQRNSNLLTTPFDIYATLQHILYYPSPPRGVKVGQSLFTEINPQNRTCKTGGVEDHWCPCLHLVKVPLDDTRVRELAKFTVKHINKLTDLNSRVKRLCRKLALKEIKVALRDMPNDKLQKFFRSYQDHHCDSCGAMFGQRAKDTMARDTLYQIHFVTSPNNGFFEASVKLVNNVPSIVGEISRVDSFGHQSDCIKDSYVHLIKFCYCR